MPTKLDTLLLIHIFKKKKIYAKVFKKRENYDTDKKKKKKKALLHAQNACEEASVCVCCVERIKVIAP